MFGSSFSSPCLSLLLYSPPYSLPFLSFLFPQDEAVVHLANRVCDGSDKDPLELLPEQYTPSQEDLMMAAPLHDRPLDSLQVCARTRTHSRPHTRSHGIHFSCVPL